MFRFDLEQDTEMTGRLIVHIAFSYGNREHMIKVHDNDADGMPHDDWPAFIKRLNEGLKTLGEPVKAQ